MRITIILVFCLFSLRVLAQSNDSLRFKEYLIKRDDVSLKGMKVLKYWGGGNLLLGGIGSFTTEGSFQYFNQANALWGGVNLLIGVIATKTYKNKAQRFEIANLQLEQKKIERTFLINAGLDVLYVGAGIALIDYSKREGVHKERVEGYAYSVILQGAFLLAFDATLYYMHKRNRKKRLEHINRIETLYGD